MVELMSMSPIIYVSFNHHHRLFVAFFYVNFIIPSPLLYVSDNLVSLCFIHYKSDGLTNIIFDFISLIIINNISVIHEILRFTSLNTRLPIALLTLLYNGIHLSGTDYDTALMQWTET